MEFEPDASRLPFFVNGDINASWFKFNDGFLSIMDYCIPSPVIALKRYRPWLSKNRTSLILKRKPASLFKPRASIVPVFSLDIGSFETGLQTSCVLLNKISLTKFCPQISVD